MNGIQGFNSYNQYFNPQFNNMRLQSPAPQQNASAATPQNAQIQTSAPKKDSDKYIKIGGAILGAALLALGAYKGKNLFKNLRNEAPRTPGSANPAASTTAQDAEKAAREAAEKAAREAEAKAAKEAQEAAERAAREAEAKAAKEAAEKAAKEAEAKAAKEAQEAAEKAAKEAEAKAAKEAAEKAKKELQNKYKAEMDVTARQKLQEINKEWAAKLDIFAGIKLMSEKSGFQKLGKNMEKLQDGTYKITSSPKNGTHFEYYSEDGVTLDKIIVIKNGRKTQSIGFRDKGKTGDLVQYNQNGKIEYGIDFVINGNKGERFVSWTNMSRKADEEGLTGLYCDFYEGKFEWNALPPQNIADGFALNNWCKI